MKSFTVKSACNLREFTDFTYPQGGFYLNILLKGKDVKVNGVRVSKNVALHAGDEVVYYTTEKQESAKSHFTVYEDKEVYIADKLSGVSSEGLYSELCAKGEFYAVHRLDRNTQGLIMFAKTRAAEAELLAAIKNRKVKKTYLALCKNNFKCDGETLVSFLTKDEARAIVKVHDTEVKNSERIITEYSVVNKEGELALLEIILHTGKTHQIRAHFAHIGCPVLGDTKYGDKELNKKYGAKRQCLVAKRLEFALSGRLGYLNGITLESSFVPAAEIK